MKLRDGVSAADTDHGTTLLDEDGGEYWNLNPTGALILRMLLDGHAPEQTAQALSEQYDVDTETARGDVADLIGGLHSAGLVED